MNARTSLIPTSTDAGYGSTPAHLAGGSSKKESSSRSRVLAAVAGVAGVVGVVALRANGVTGFAAEGEAITFDKVLAAQVREPGAQHQEHARRQPRVAFGGRAPRGD